MTPLPRPVLLYDGGCRLCRFAARIVDSADRHGRIALLPLEDGAAGDIVAGVPEAERLASWHLVRPGGRIVSRGAVAVEVLEALGYDLPARAAHHLSPLVERAYSLVAGHRDRLGPLVPNGPAPRRFP